MIRLALLMFLLTALPLLTAAQETPAQKAKRMKWFKEARFGMFIHWGTYSVLEGEWNGQKNHAEWIRETAQIPLDEYTKVKDRFNPVKFDPAAWARMAKDAGMKYVVITSKHHEGFALFDSQYSDYDVMSTPYKKDIMKMLADAVRKEGLVMCWYHSIMDWHHPDYLPRRTWEASTRPATGADMNRYVQFLHNQVTELLTKYGPIGIMWFDGEWESTWNHGYGQPLYDLCRRLQPNTIVNNRVDVGRGGMGGMSDAGFAGDYGTPEQEIPATGIPGVDWETCMTLNANWGFNRADKNYKSTTQVVQMLCDIVSKGGNYLLNIGPTPEGEFPPESVQRLKEIGAWMKVNGDAIYGTTASPFKKLNWGRATVKGTSLFLHVFDWPKNRQLDVPGLGSEVVSAKLLSGGAKVAAKATDSGVVLTVPAKAPDAHASVIELRLKGAPVVYEAPEIQADSNQFVKPLTVKIAATNGLEVRYTMDGTNPTAKSPVSSGKVVVKSPCVLKARAFFKGKPVAKLVSQEFQKAVPLPPARDGRTAQGLEVRQWEGDWNDVPELWFMKSPKETKVLDGVTISDIPLKENVARFYVGLVEVPEDEVYKFALRSDDGSRLWVDGQLVVDNSGLHSPLEKTGTIALAKGKHQIHVEWHNKTGGLDLQLRMGPVGQEPRGITNAQFSHRIR